MATFFIKSDDGTIADAQPVEGKWYCGFEVSYERDGEKWMRDGEIAKCIDGEFYDEDGEPVDMAGYDYLVQQH